MEHFQGKKTVNTYQIHLSNENVSDDQKCHNTLPILQLVKITKSKTKRSQNAKEIQNTNGMGM